MKTTRITNQGSTILAVILMTVIFIGLGASLLLGVKESSTAAYQNSAWNEALYCAESGLEAALQMMKGVSAYPVSAPYATNAPTFTEFTRTMPVRTSEGVGTSYGSYRVTFSPFPMVNNARHYMVTSEGEMPVVGTQRALAAYTTTSGTTTTTDRLRTFFFKYDSDKNAALGATDARTRRVVRMYVGQATPIGITPSATATPAVVIATPTPDTWHNPDYSRYAFFSRQWVRLQSENAYTDSYDSTDPTKSTNGEYDPAKRQQNGNVASMASGGNVELYGRVYGSVMTNKNLIQYGINSGRPPNNNYVRSTGAIATSFTGSLPTPPLPTWTTWEASPSGNNAQNGGTYTAGPIGQPKRYKMENVGNMTFALPAGQSTGEVEVWVRGNINANSINVPNGVRVKVYVEMGVNLNGPVNNTSRKPVNFQLIGVRQNGTSAINANMNAAFYGVIYAPMYELNPNGGQWYGAFATYSSTINNNAAFHYDESLGRLLSGGSSGSSTPTPTPTPGGATPTPGVPTSFYPGTYREVVWMEDQFR